MYVGVESVRLWDLVRDKSVHLILKKPALQELADRRDKVLIHYCEDLIQSETFDEWLVGVEILSTLGTSAAIERLIALYTQTNLTDRRRVTYALAKVLTAECVHPFGIMVRELAKPGQLDVTGWTLVAIATLKHVCKRFGVKVDDRSLDSTTHSEYLGLLDRTPTMPKGRRKTRQKVVQQT